MDTETLKFVGSLLLWGGLFFVMMRYGCGAHIMGGHHRHRAPEGGDSSARDHVCGMPVPREASSAAAVHQGRTYYFCSRSCRDKFEADPEQYAAGAPRPASTARHA